MEKVDISNKKVFILVNTLHAVNANVYSNHCHFFTYSAKNIPGIQFEFWTPERMAIDTARNTAAQMALNRNCDYLMFIDDDVMIPPDTLEKLLKADKDIIAGLVIIRGYPFNNMLFKFGTNIIHGGKETRSLGYFNDLEYEYLLDNDTWISNKKREEYNFNEEALPKRLKELQECDAVGFSCCLIKTDILKPLEPPYFLTGKFHTEDVYFCMKVQDKLEPKPGIFVHTGVQPGHMMNAEPVEYAIKEKLKVFYDSLMYKEDPEKKEEDTGRNQDYINACMAAIKEVK